MDFAEVYRSSRQVVCSTWRRMTAMGSLRFPDAVQERRFAQHAGEHGLSVMRMHRVVDASLFYITAKGAAGRHSNAWVGAFISTAGRWASALQLLALAATLFAPRFTARNHELLKVVCQHVNFLSVVVMTWVITSFRSRYQIVHACNVMFSAVNFLPGQVRVSVFAPIVIVQSLIWIYTGARSRALNPEHAGAPLAMPHMWAQHVALTVFMSFGLSYCVGTVLEMHARQSFVRTHHLEGLDWQPGILPTLMVQTLEFLTKAKRKLLEALGSHGKQQMKTFAGKQSCPAEEAEQWECKQPPGAVSTHMRDPCCADSAKLCSQSAYAAPVRSACCPGTQAQPRDSAQTLAGVSSNPASGCPAEKQPPLGANHGQHKSAGACCPSAMEAHLAHAHKDVSLAVVYQGTVCSKSDSSSLSPASSSFDSGSDTDVSEARQVCCGVEGVQAQACQKLLNKGRALDSKCRQLACRVELLETEVGKDSLAAMAEQVRSHQLLQQIAALTQRVNAQRCVTTFLGSQEDALRAEVESLRKERKQLTAELGKAHALIEETAADRLEATELLSRAVHIMKSMRNHMSVERQAMWQCILQMLHLQPDATPIEASASFARRVGKGSCADGGDLARLLQSLAEEGTLSHRASEVPSHRASECSHSSSSAHLRSREGIQHGGSTSPTEAPAGVQRGQQEDPDIADAQLSEVLHQIGSCGLPGPIRTGMWDAFGDSLPHSPVHDEQRPAAPDAHVSTEVTAGSMGSMGDLGSEGPNGATGPPCDGAGQCSSPTGLLEVKQQQDAGWVVKVDGQVKELYLSVLRRLNTGAAAQTEWLSSAKTTLSGSMQQPCSTCKALSEKVAEVEAQRTGLQGAVVVVLRSMMAQQRTLRKELGELASELGASMSAQGGSHGQRVESCSAEPVGRPRRCGPRKCTTPNTLAGGQGLGAAAGCCWQGLEEPDQDGQAARSVAQRLQELLEASAESAQAASEVTEMLFPVPSIREISNALAGADCSQVEAHLNKSLSWMASWLQTANPPNASSTAGEPVCAERLRGALEVVVSGLVDRAFATQTAYVHCAHSLSKQTQALTSLNAHLMNVRQKERRMLEMLMNNRAQLLTHMAVLRTCSRVALCRKCHAPGAPDSLASSPAA